MGSWKWLWKKNNLKMIMEWQQSFITALICISLFHILSEAFCLYQIPWIFLSSLLFIFPFLFSHLLSPLHFSSLSQIFRGLSHISVLSCLPYTVSSLLWGYKTRMSSTYEASARIGFLLWFRYILLLKSQIIMFLTKLWKPWGHLPTRSEQLSRLPRCCLILLFL